MSRLKFRFLNQVLKSHPAPTQIFSELQVYQDTIEEGNFSNDEAILKYMETTLEKNDAYPLGLYMGDDSGIYLDGSGWVPDDDWVLTERDWYIDGKDNETLSFGEPYYDSMTGDVCVSASVHIDYPNAVRVLATDVYLDYVASLVSEISNESSTKVFLVTGNSNTIIAHHDTNMLAVSLDTEGNDEIARMSNNMQMFISKMRETILEISNTADWLNKQSVENGKVSDSLLDSSKSQANAMQLLSKLADQLSTSADEVAGRMDSLAGLIRETYEEGTISDKLMTESVSMSQSGRNDMKHINNGMESISHSINTLAKQIDKVGDSTAQIGNMVNLIMDIAEETNLLSLNASIEAARAGEAGKGFAIVAEQISKLAASSSSAADDISKLTAEIKDTVAEAVLHMNTSVSEEMKKITENQKLMAEQITDATKESNYHTENVTTNSNVVAENAAALKKESMTLMEKMNRFRL